MSGFIKWLDGLNQRDSRLRAILRRSLSFDPGTLPSAYPYVEPFLKEQDNSWCRIAHYLVAGLWAQHWRDGRGGGVSLGKAAALQMLASQSASTEARFIALLDADEDQLLYRLRQMIALLNDQEIDFESLLTGLIHWRNDGKPTQTRWAKDFYRTLNHDNNLSEETP